MNAIYDEHKKVYRVNNADGTFDTYTPEQYRALSHNEEEVSEEVGDPSDPGFPTETETEVHRPDFAEVKDEDRVQDDVQDTPIEDEAITIEPNPQS